FASRLDTIPGRKVVVLASAGLAVSPRAGGRPDVGNLPDELGTALTRADAAFYTLLLDGLATVGAADGRRSNPGRDREVLGRWLDQFSSSMGDRKSTRLNSSHVKISYAVFCLKKKTA